MVIGAKVAGGLAAWKSLPEDPGLFLGGLRMELAKGQPKRKPAAAVDRRQRLAMSRHHFENAARQSK